VPATRTTPGGRKVRHAGVPTGHLRATPKKILRHLHEGTCFVAAAPPLITMAYNLQDLPRWGAEMIYKAGCSILLLASAVMAQQVLMPGTVASAAAFDSGSGTSSPSSFDAANSSSSDARQPITGQQRIDWVVKGTIGPEGLAGEIFGAGWDTLFNTPKVYGPHWQGFGDRLGMSMAGNAVSNTMEAGLGAIWGEDPRYTREPEATFGHRIGHVVKMTFMAQNRNGDVIPAYARFIATPGSNFLSNAWRAPGDDTARDAAVRTGLGFLGHMGNNTFDEFWPDFQRKLFHRNHSDQQ
jgi:hypothetical protein